MKHRSSIFLVALAWAFSWLTASAADLGCADLNAAFHTIGLNDWSANPNQWNLYQIEADGDFVYFMDTGTLVGIVDVSDPRHPVVLPQAMWTDAAPTAFDYAASFVYVVGGSELVIFDVSIPSAPRQVGALALPAQASCVAVEGARAYVSRDSEVVGGRVLDVIDVADSTAPRLVRTIDGLSGRSARVVGSRLYLLDGNLEIADLSDPDWPTLLGTWNAESPEHPGLDFDVAGEFIYLVAAPAELLVLDVADAAQPTLVGSWSAGLEFPASARSVAIMDSHAIVGGEDALHVVDISDPAAPFERGRLTSMDNNEDIAVANGRIYVAHRSYWLEVIEPGNFRPLVAEHFQGTDEPIADLSPSPEPGLCLVLAGSQLKVLDHADPGSSSVVASLDLPGEPRRLVTVGNRALVACGAAGLIVVDVADPRAPVLQGAVPGVSGAVDLEAVGSLVHGTGDGGPYWVVDAAAAGMPVLRGTLPVAIEAMAIAVDGANAYLASWSQVQALDVSNPTAPVPRFIQDWWWDWPLSGPELVARDGLLHGLGSYRLLTLEDMGDSLRVVGVTPVAGPDLAFDGNLAIAPGPAGGANVLDFANPREPAYVGTIECEDTWETWGTCVAVSGDQIIVGLEYGGLLVAPRLCPTTVPVEVSSFSASRVGDVVRLRWVVAGAFDATQFRIVVGGTAGDRVLTGAPVGVGVYEAVDAAAAGSAIPVEYVLERRDSRGLWRAISTLTYVPTPVTAATRLTGCRPNPFNPSTSVTFTLARGGQAVVTVHDAAGRLVAVLADRHFSAGPHALAWDGRDRSGRAVASGVYLVRLRLGEVVDQGKVLLVR